LSFSSRDLPGYVPAVTDSTSQPLPAESALNRGAAAFVTTRWSVVLRAGGVTEPDAAQALGQLYEAYWYPLYAYIRRRGHGPEPARDFVQEVFLRLLENNQLSSVAPERGRFRSYLLTAVNHLLAGDWQRQNRVKRGGGIAPVELDALAAEERYRVEPPDACSPEKLYDRRWALALLDRVFARLRAEWEAAGKGAMFDGLRGFLSGEDAQGYAAAGAAVGLSEGAARVTVHRLRQQYRERLRDEIAQTVDEPGRVDDELRHLLAALRE
jgi:RNA polymerase sigma-70 factor (ECF subfamily)